MQPDANEAFLKLVREFEMLTRLYMKYPTDTAAVQRERVSRSRTAVKHAIQQIQARRQQGTMFGHVSPDDYDPPIVR